MTKYLSITIFITLSSCINQNDTSLELNIVSKNHDTIQNINEFYFKSLTKPNKTILFKNIDCIAPNKFLFKNLTDDLFIGLMRIDNNNSSYNISIDSIKIKKGKNIITKEINLGTIKL
jgi:hypothetical protein